jgi:hypothetical protein
VPQKNSELTPPPSSDVVVQGITVSPDQLGDQLKNLETLQERANALELRAADLSVKASQLAEQRARASDADRPRLDKQWADAQHDVAATSIELSALHKKISQVERLLAPSTAVTIAPPALMPTSELTNEQIMQLAGGFGMLLIPLVLVLARNMWIRGSRKTRTADAESAPQLQRIEQAIEAIAVEVERIGEAQRFSTKLLSERQPDAIANRAAVPIPRREPGSITPH